MPNKNTERHKSSKGTLLAIFEKRKVRWKRKGGGERRRTRQAEGRGGGPSSSSSSAATQSHCGMSKQNILLEF